MVGAKDREGSQSGKVTAAKEKRARSAAGMGYGISGRSLFLPCLFWRTRKT